MSEKLKKFIKEYYVDFLGIITISYFGCQLGFGGFLLSLFFFILTNEYRKTTNQIIKMTDDNIFILSYITIEGVKYECLGFKEKTTEIRILKEDFKGFDMTSIKKIKGKEYIIFYKICNV